MKIGALVIVVSVGLSFALTALPCRAWDVEPASTGNSLILDLFDLDHGGNLDGVDVSVVHAPAWINGLSVGPSPEDPLAPDADAAMELRFDVSGSVRTETSGDIDLTIRARDGREWRQTIPLTAVERADREQTDCCTSIEITPSGVTPAGIAAGGDLVVETAPNPAGPVSQGRDRCLSPLLLS